MATANSGDNSCTMVATVRGDDNWSTSVGSGMNQEDTTAWTTAIIPSYNEREGGEENLRHHEESNELVDMVSSSFLKTKYDVCIVVNLEVSPSWFLFT
jgi:hypothetical protein